MPSLTSTVRTGFACYVLSAAVVAGMVGLTGCDSESGKADKRIDQAVAAASTKLRGGPAERGEAQKLIDSAVQNNADASPANRLYAKLTQAQFEQAAAEAMLPEIDSRKATIDRLSWEITRLASQIATRNTLASGLAKYEPTSVQTAIGTHVNDIRGSETKPDWIKSDSGQISALAKVKSDITELQTKISQLQDSIKSLTDQRTQLVTQSDQLNQKSEQAKGNESVELFKQGAAAQKQASDLSVQLDQANVQLNRAQADLAVSQGQQVALETAIKDFGAQSDAVSANWTEVSNQIKSLGEGTAGGSKALLGESAAVNPDSPLDPTGGKTIASKGDQIAYLNTLNRSRRDEAEGHINNAINFYKESASLADTLASDLQKKIIAPENATKPDLAAWKSTVEALTPARYKLQQANANQERAALFAGRAAEANTRTNLATMLKPILDAAKFQLPAGFTDNDNKIAEDLKNGRQEADLSFKESDDLLTGILEGSAPAEQKSAAGVARIFTQYGWSLLADSAGDKAKADEHLKTAKEARDNLGTEGRMPHLPPELAIAPVKPAANPGTPAAPPQ